jgi:hypothetical protein
LWLRDHGTAYVRDRNNLIAFTIKAARSMPGRGLGKNGESKWLSAARQISDPCRYRSTFRRRSG